MAKDEEFRKVAEDVRALARSLANDFRGAVDHSRMSGNPTTKAFKHGIKGMADEARRGVRSGMHRHPGYQHWRRTVSGSGWWGGPPWPPPAPPGEPGAAPPGSPTGGAPYVNVPPWGPPVWNRHGRRWDHNHPGANRRRRSPLPPVRRRWDATTVLGLLAVVFGVAWLLGALGAMHISIEAVVAVGLMLLGASLVITGRTDWSLSRRSWPVWLGIGLIGVLVATSTTFGVGGALSSIRFGTVNASPVQSGTIHGGFGTLKIDAGNVPTGGVLNIDSVAGQTIVSGLPADVLISAKVLAGQICVNGYDVSDGVNASYNQPTPLASLMPGRLVVNVHQVFGQIQIGNVPGCQHR